MLARTTRRCAHSHGISINVNAGTCIGPSCEAGRLSLSYTTAPQTKCFASWRSDEGRAVVSALHTQNISATLGD
jgi:hypothetical protein